MLRLVVPISLIACLTSACALGALQGGRINLDRTPLFDTLIRVRDAQGVPVQGARCQSESDAALTNNDGDVRLRVPKGLRAVRCSHAEFKDRTSAVYEIPLAPGAVIEVWLDAR